MQYEAVVYALDGGRSSDAPHAQSTLTSYENIIVPLYRNIIVPLYS